MSEEMLGYLDSIEKLVVNIRNEYDSLGENQQYLLEHDIKYLSFLFFSCCNHNGIGE